MTARQILLVGLGAAALSGLFHRSLRGLVDNTAVAIRESLDATLERLRHIRRWLALRRRKELAALGFGGERWKASYVAGAVGSTAVFALLLVSDVHSVSLTLEALNVFEGGLELPLGIGSVFVLATVVPAVYSAWFLREIGRGEANLIPTHHFGRLSRYVYQGIAAVVIALILSVVVVQGLFRAEGDSRPRAEAASDRALDVLGPVSEGDPSAALAAIDAQRRPIAVEPGTWERRATIITLTALPLALLLSTVLAFEVGPATLLQLVPLAGIAGMLSLVAVAGMLTTFGGAVLAWTYALIVSVLAVIQRFGITVTRPIVTLFRQVHAWADSRVRAGRRSLRHDGSTSGVAPWLSGALTHIELMVAHLALVASSWSRDVEVPEGGVGDRIDIDPVALPLERESADDGPPDTVDPRVPRHQRDSEVGESLRRTVPDASGSAAGPSSDSEAPSEFGLEIDDLTASRGWDPYGASRDGKTSEEGATP